MQIEISTPADIVPHQIKLMQPWSLLYTDPWILLQSLIYLFSQIFSTKNFNFAFITEENVFAKKIKSKLKFMIWDKCFYFIDMKFFKHYLQTIFKCVIFSCACFKSLSVNSFFNIIHRLTIWNTAFQLSSM